MPQCPIPLGLGQGKAGRRGTLPALPAETETETTPPCALPAGRRRPAARVNRGKSWHFRAPAEHYRRRDAP